MADSFKNIIDEGRLLYRYVRGSHLYNLNTSTSDVDEGGVFIARPTDLLGISSYCNQVSDTKHDTTWFEVGELLRLLLKSNPTVLESLFVPKYKILGEVHPYMQLILDNKEAFISKDCFNPFFGYAKSQISKASGLNKKINMEPMQHKTPFDFIYTFKHQGSTKVANWLENRGLKQEFCGLVNIPNMHDIYGLYYDFGAHYQTIKEESDEEIFKNYALFMDTVINHFHLFYERDALKTLSELPIKHYRGIVSDDENAEPRLSSVEDKNEKPLCFISYNQSGYASHCKKYKEYKTWEKERNPARYESNLNKSYDGKNMMHCFRLIHMAKEIAQGQGIILERNEDRDFLLSIKNHELEYDKLFELLLKEKEEMETLMEQSTIREHVDYDLANGILLDIRKKQLG